MKPKEKAKELIDNFLDYSWSDLELKGDEYSKSLRENAKQCALICCNEMIQELNEIDLSTDSLLKVVSNNRSCIGFVQLQKYWEEVKKEINDLSL